MQKKIYILLAFVIIILNPIISMAQTTNEVEIDKLFEMCGSIVSNKEIEKLPTLIDYSIQILKYEPNSLRADYTIGFICFAGSHDEKCMKDKFFELYEKYYANIENTENDMAEKIVVAGLLLCGFSINEMTYAETEISNKNGNRILRNIIDNCANKDYAALGMLMLDLGISNDESKELCEKFKSDFPTHKAMPLVDLRLLSRKFYYSKPPNYLVFIDEINKLIEKYKNIDSPRGQGVYKITVEYYASILEAYIKLNNINEAQNYFALIKKEAPEYYDLKRLEWEIKVVVGNSRKNK